MSFTYSQVAELKNTEKVGSHQCVALVQTYAGLPHTSAWKPGGAVRVLGRGSMDRQAQQTRSTGFGAIYYVSAA